MVANQPSPSPPFTPTSFHFTLGSIYTGTLVFSHRGYDLDTAFHVLRSLIFPPSTEIQARIVQEMMHGLFHAFLEFTEYERITGDDGEQVDVDVVSVHDARHEP